MSLIEEPGLQTGLPTYEEARSSLFLYFSPATQLGLVIASSTSARLVHCCEYSSMLLGMRLKSHAAEIGDEVLTKFRLLSGGQLFRWGLSSGCHDLTKAFCWKAGVKPSIVAEHIPDLVPTSFLTVGYDIRYLIYGHFFPSGATLHMYVGRDSVPFGNEFLQKDEDEYSWRSSKNLMQVSRLVNQETTELLYKRNRFIYDPPWKEDCCNYSHNAMTLLPNLRASTKLIMTRFEVWVSPETKLNYLHVIPRYIAEFPNLEIRVYGSCELDMAASKMRYIALKRFCMIVAEVRGGTERDSWKLAESSNGHAQLESDDECFRAIREALHKRWGSFNS